MTSSVSVPLGEVAEFIRGINFKPDDVFPVGTEGTVACMRTKNVQEMLDCDDVWGVPKDFVRRRNQILQEGDVLVSSANSWNLVGKCCWIPKLPWEASFGGFVSVLRANATVADPRYVYRWFSSDRIQALLRSFGQKTTNISNLNIDRCLNLSISIPPLSEQRRIAAILDQADALRAKRREAMAQLDSLTQSIFIEMFGDPVRNDRDWPTKSVNDLCELVRGSSPRPQGDPKYFGGPVPRLMVADITRDGWLVTPAIDSLTLEGAKRSRPVSAGTVVMAVSGNIGLVSRLAVDACVHDGFVAFTSLDETVCEPGYLLALLHFSKAVHEKNKAGAIFINLTTTDIKAMQIPLPSLELQREFGLRLEKAQSLRDAHTSSSNQIDSLFASLQHRAFRGDL